MTEIPQAVIARWKSIKSEVQTIRKWLDDNPDSPFMLFIAHSSHENTLDLIKELKDSFLFVYVVPGEDHQVLIYVFRDEDTMHQFSDTLND